MYLVLISYPNSAGCPKQKVWKLQKYQLYCNFKLALATLWLRQKQNPHKPQFMTQSLTESYKSRSSTKKTYVATSASSRFCLVYSVHIRVKYILKIHSQRRVEIKRIFFVMPVHKNQSKFKNTAFLLIQIQILIDFDMLT